MNDVYGYSTILNSNQINPKSRHSFELLSLGGIVLVLVFRRCSNSRAQKKLEDLKKMSKWGSLTSLSSMKSEWWGCRLENALRYFSLTSRLPLEESSSFSELIFAISFFTTPLASTLVLLGSSDVWDITPFGGRPFLNWANLAKASNKCIQVGNSNRKVKFFDLLLSTEFLACKIWFCRFKQSSDSAHSAGQCSAGYCQKQNM